MVNIKLVKKWVYGIFVIEIIKKIRFYKCKILYLQCAMINVLAVEDYMMKEMVLKMGNGLSWMMNLIIINK